MIGSKTISKLSTDLERDLAKELRDQGHYLTGALERSIKSRQTNSGNSFVLETEANDYITDLNEGVPASQIQVDVAYVQELAAYAQKRFGVSGGAALRAGYNIAKKHAIEGNPTKASYQYSNTGDRLHAIEDSYQKNEAEYDQQIETSLSQELDDLIDHTFTETLF